MLQDLRFGLRLWSRRPVFVATVVATLALGLGGTTALFSVFNGVFLSPLPYPEPERLVMVWEAVIPAGVHQLPPSYPNYADWVEQAESFESLAAMDHEYVTITGPQGPERGSASLVSSSIFDILRVSPAMGRLFTAEDDRPDGNLVAILRHSFWQHRFGGDPDIVGKTFVVEGYPVEVAGVLPQDFKPPIPILQTDMWVPLQLFLEEQAEQRGTGFLAVMGRLEPGVSIEAARAEMDAIALRLQREYPDVNNSHTINVISLQEQIFGRYRLLLLTLMAAVGFLLLISCINVANLLLARASERSPEIAIRTTLGAGRTRLIRQLLVESLLLAFLGAAFGLVFAYFCRNLLIRLGFEALPVSGDAEIDARVLLFTLGVTLVTGIAFGLIPGLRASSPKLTEVLKAGGRTTSALSRFRGRKVLVAFEVAMAVILLAGAGLMAASLFRMQRVDLGFNPDDLLTLDVSLPATQYPDGSRQAAYFRQVTERVEALPEVIRAGWVTHPPLSARSTSMSFHIRDRPVVNVSDLASADFRGVTDGYFEVLNVPLVAGRGFEVTDDASSPQVAVVDTSTARQYWPNESPLGKSISIEGPQGPWMTVVGQVQDVRYAAPGEEERPTIYYHFAQRARASMTLVARTATGPAAAVRPVREAVLAVDPSQPVENVRPMSRMLASKLQGREVNTLLLGVFALIALVLAAVGIYGVISQYVAHYVREIGIRMALGAQRRDIFTMVLKQGMGAVLVGVVVGVAGALGLARLIASLLFGVEPSDPATFAAVSFVLLSVAFLACSMPAARAVRVQPVNAMRQE